MNHILILVLFVSVTWTQEVLENLSVIFLKQKLALERLESKDSSQHLKKNFRGVWTNEKHSKYNLGYLGSNYQRLRVKVLSASKTDGLGSTYRVKGKTRTQNFECSFTGEIEIIHVREVKESDSPSMTQGLVVFKYYFKEDTNQKGSGFFSGIGASSWYYKEKGTMKYDDFSTASENYTNNEFVGTWTSHKTGQIKKAIWGDFRIPFSNGLDVGLGEFYPDSTFQNNGWASYVEEKQRNQEPAIWWKD